jgi:hypothetical protein
MPRDYITTRPWKYIQHEGEQLFQYMLTHTLSSDTTIDHFFIYCTDTNADPYVYQIDKSYRAEVEPVLAAWIQKEEREGRLKDRSLWKTIREPETNGLTAMLVYRHLCPFTPTHPPIHPYWKPGEVGEGPEENPLEDGTYPKLTRIFFMLSLVWGCRECDLCHDDFSETVHFVGGLYGWEESDTPYLKPRRYYRQSFKADDPYCKVVDDIWFSPPDDEDDDPNWDEEDEKECSLDRFFASTR